MAATASGTGKDPSVSCKHSTQPDTGPLTSIPQITPALALPVFTETARTSAHASVSNKLSTQPDTSPLTSIPQTIPTLLPVFTETASARPSPATYRLRSILIRLLQVVSASILIVIGFV